MADSDERTFFPAPRRNASVVGCQISLLHFGCDMRDFHSRLAQPPIALAGLAAEPLAPTLQLLAKGLTISFTQLEGLTALAGIGAALVACIRGFELPIGA